MCAAVQHVTHARRFCPLLYIDVHCNLGLDFDFECMPLFYLVSSVTECQVKDSGSYHKEAIA